MANFGFRDMRSQAELLLAPKRPKARTSANLSAIRVNIGGVATPGVITNATQISGAVRKQVGDAIKSKAAVASTVSSVTSVLAQFDAKLTQLRNGTFIPRVPIGTGTISTFPDVDDFLSFSALNPGEPIPTAFLSSIAERKQQLQQLAGSLSTALTKGGVQNGLSLTENLSPSSYPLDDELDLPTVPRLSQGGAIAKADAILRDKVRFTVRGVQIGTGKPSSWSRLLSTAAIKAASNLNPAVNQLFKDRKNNSTWSEPVSPYAAQFPHNKVQQTESGHTIELDDTPGAERVHIFHRSGSFVEMHPDGTVVYKNMKDGYDLTMGSKFVKVSGACHISVDGNATVHAKGNIDLQSEADVSVQAKGDFNVFAKNVNLRAKKTFKADGQKMDLRYIVLPTGIVPVPYTGQFAPRVNMAAMTADFPGGNFAAITKAWAKMPLDPRVVPSLSLGTTPAAILPPENPLSNLSVYEKTTPQAVLYRARLFDTPEEVNDFELFNGHQTLQETLKDTTGGSVLGGELTTLDTGIETVAPTITYLPFDDFKGTYTYADTYALGNTSFRLADVVDLALHPTVIKDMSTVVGTFEGVPEQTATTGQTGNGELTPGGDHEDYRDAWYASGGGKTSDLLRFNAENLHLGGTVFGSKNSKVLFADGAAFQAVRSAGEGGGLGPCWDRL